MPPSYPPLTTPSLFNTTATTQHNVWPNENRVAEISLSGALDGAWGVVAGLALGVAVVASSGVAPSGRDSGCIRVWSWLLRLALCGSGMHDGAGGWAGRWVVAGGCLSVIFYLVNCMYYCNLCHGLF